MPPSLTPEKIQQLREDLRYYRNRGDWDIAAHLEAVLRRHGITA